MRPEIVIFFFLSASKHLPWLFAPPRMAFLPMCEAPLVFKTQGPCLQEAFFVNPTLRLYPLFRGAPRLPLPSLTTWAGRLSLVLAPPAWGPLQGWISRPARLDFSNGGGALMGSWSPWGPRGAMSEEIVISAKADSISIFLREGGVVLTLTMAADEAGGRVGGAPALPSPTLQTLTSFHFTGAETGWERTRDTSESHTGAWAPGLEADP